MSAAAEFASLRIEAMTEHDIGRIIEIEITGYDFPWTPAIFSDCLQVGYQCAVLKDADRVLGYAIFSMAAGEAHLLNLCVDDTEHGKGYGSQLLSHVLLTVSEEGCRDIFLEVRPSNEAALTLYRRFGFRAIGTRPKYYRALGGREDAMVLTCALNTGENDAVFAAIPPGPGERTH